MDIETKKIRKISDLEDMLSRFKMEHGDVDISCYFECDEVNENHKVSEYRLSLTWENRARLVM